MPLVALVDTLASMRGVVAVVLGGSRAAGTSTPSSDWDLGVYYRDGLETHALERFGTVYPPGSWGRIMNGGAWLTVEGMKVDVLFRDLAVVEHWSARARAGEFEVEALLGYVAGVPTYSLAAERAVAITLRGELPRAEPYPSKLALSGPTRWRFHSRFSFDYASMHAKRGDAIATAGQISKAVLEEAHARMCEQRRWLLNEKGLVLAAKLGDVERFFGAIPSDADSLVQWVAAVRDALA